MVFSAIVLVAALGAGFVFRDRVRGSRLARALGVEAQQETSRDEYAGHAEMASEESSVQETGGRNIL